MPTDATKALHKRKNNGTLGFATGCVAVTFTTISYSQFVGSISEFQRQAGMAIAVSTGYNPSGNLNAGTDMQVDVTATAAQNALSRVLASDEFREADRLSEFLRYVVEESLAGRSDGIKATTIAVDVFKRKADEESSSDSIVRVTAARLRRKLSYYYSSAGKGDPVRIEMASGSYVPYFTNVEEIHGEDSVDTSHSPTIDSDRKSRPGIGYVVPIVLMLAVLAAIAYAVYGSRDIVAPITQKSTADRRSGNSSLSPSAKPFVVVLPLSGVGDEELSRKISAGYLEAVITHLSKLSGLSVMAPRSSIAAAKFAIPLEELRRERGVTHVLQGSIATQSDRLRIGVQLVDTHSGAALFAERFEGKLSDLFELEDRVANRIATALAVTVDSDESRRLYLRHTDNREAIALLRLATLRINPPNERARIEASRALHQRVISLDSKFAGGYAGMSQVHSYMVLFRHSDQPESDLNKAIEFAEKAIDLDASFASGHAMLGLAYSLSGKTDLALKQVRRAVALGPGDPLAHQWLGGVLLFSGRPTEAVPALLEAQRLDPIEPRTPYLNILGMAYFSLEQYDNAVSAFESNILKGGPDAPNMEAYRAATYAALGRESDARNVIARFDGKPRIIAPEYWIRRWTPFPEISRKAIESLYRLGMQNRDKD